MTQTKANPAEVQPVETVTLSEVEAQPEITYFQQRIINDLGITPELNTIKLKYFDLESQTTRQADYQIFSEDEAGNIRILPFSINRELIIFDSPKATPQVRNIENSRQKVFCVTRLKNPEEFTDKTGSRQVKKYNFPKGAETVPFITPGLIQKFERAEPIKTLVLTEGYFKAFKGYMNGLDIVGLSSISHYKEKDTKTLYTDILKLIQVCKVENIILLYDGDARNISLKDLERKDDLRRRPNGFINSARNIRELLKDYPQDLYFASVNSTEIEGQPKGLDDLYCAMPAEAATITTDLISFSRTPLYFNRHPIKAEMGKLYKWFFLDNVENFFAFHSQVIGTREFNYNGTLYRYNTDKGNCDVITPGEAKLYFRVGDDYYKFVKIPNKYQQDEHKFVRRLKSTIELDHGKGIIKHIPKYEAFCNVPDHVNYQQVFNNCFNVYAPFQHEPEPGDCKTILMFINHIFGPQYEYGLDYIQLLYQKPTQTLPILCLVSKENKTGKSTFIKLIKAIFGQNATVVGNEELANQFNSFWSTKLVVMIEETFIDKKSTTERVKSLSTGDKITMNAKGRDQIEMDFFAKFLLASNNEDTFIYANSDDVRYWVVKVPVFSGRENVTLLRDMIDEIPAFLYFLNNRKMFAQEESRMWFNEDLLKTEALEKLRQNSRPAIEKEIYEALKTIYFEFGEQVIYMTPTNANDLFLKRKQDNSYLGRLFRENLKANVFCNEEGKEILKSYSIPFWNQDDTGEMIRKEHRFKGRPYVFKVENILDRDDLAIYRQMHQHNGQPKPEPEPEPEKIHQTTIFEAIAASTNQPVNEEDLPF